MTRGLGRWRPELSQTRMTIQMGSVEMRRAARPESTFCSARIISVPAVLHQRFKYADRVQFFQMIAKNVAIRRARGRFVLATNIDIIFSDELMQYIARQQLDPTKMYRVDLHVLSGIMYIGLGWVALFVLPALARAMSPIGLALVLIGGVLYTLGALVFALHRPDPWPEWFGYHEVWHAFTIAAATAFYLSILLLYLTD